MTHELAIILSLAALVALGIDWLQTIYIARNPARFFEINPILGRHPSVRRVNCYFALCMAVSVAAALGLLYLGQDAPLAVLAFALLALELYWVLSNRRLGIRLGWQD